MGMKLPYSKIFSFILLLVSGALSAQTTVTSDVVGYLKITCLGGSDTVVGVPLPKSTVVNSTVDSVNPGASQITLTLITMTASEYQDSHFVRFGEGSSLEGAKMTISANTNNTLTLEAVSGYDLSDVSVGDELAIIPHATLSELFESVATIPEGTEIFYFDSTGASINKSSAGGYIYYAPTWYDSSTFANADGAVLFPDDALIVRVPGDVANDFNLIISGEVPNVGHSFPVVTSSAGANDNLIAPQIPVALTIATLFSNASDGDEVLLFDNNARAINKSSSAGYIYYAPTWYDSSTFDNADNVLLNPWELAVYRRANQNGQSAAIFSGRDDYLNNL
ncbi:MAG: hypothetical protein CNC89_00680 [Puniceicoccaceae bacterium MED-G31]|nr:MAG: hypothetical protein CNC89_00680 [Puniceicoccaceae bacterium MED-G31]